MLVNIVIETSGLLFLLGLTAYVGLLLVIQFRESVQHNRIYELQRQLLCAKVEEITDSHKQQQTREHYAWSGFRKFLVRGKVLEAEEICSFYLVPHDGKPLPSFLPGQYLTFQIHLPGVTKPVIRCYSLSDSPAHLEYYRVTIKRLLPPKEITSAPPGQISTFFHHHLRQTDIIDVKAPAGHFVLDTRQHHRPVVLIGGGIGITPVLSILNSIAESGSSREAWFFYGVRNGREHIMKNHLQNLAKTHANMHLHVCYSQPDSNDVQERDYDHRERISLELLKRLLPSSNYDFFVCGPPSMMDSMTEGLCDWGVPMDHIHAEAFGAATVKKVFHPEAQQDFEDVEAVSVTFARSEKICNWNQSNVSILELAEQNGVSLEYGCRAGNCGSCLVAIRSGEVKYLNEPGVPIETGSCLACIAVPHTKLVIDA